MYLPYTGEKGSWSTYPREYFPYAQGKFLMYPWEHFPVYPRENFPCTHGKISYVPKGKFPIYPRENFLYSQGKIIECQCFHMDGGIPKKLSSVQ